MTDQSRLTPLAGKKEASTLTRPMSSGMPGRIKSEPSPGRLPSLRGPRDLTLGGIKKKTFAPNIPVRKDRLKAEVPNEVKPNLKQSRGKRDRSRDGRGRGRGRGKKFDTIQSHSIFEDGPTAASTHRGRESLSSFEPTSTIHKPTIKKESFDVAHEKSESDAVMRKLDENNAPFIADLDNDESLSPVTLPLAPSDLDHKKASTSDLPSNPWMTSHAFRDGGFDNLILLQLPDSIPGIPAASPEEEEDAVKVKKEPGVSQGQ